jgi:hypothetical protein
MLTSPVRARCGARDNSRASPVRAGVHPSRFAGASRPEKFLRDHSLLSINSGLLPPRFRAMMATGRRSEAIDAIAARRRWGAATMRRLVFTVIVVGVVLLGAFAARPALASTVVARIDLSEQRMYVSIAGKPAYTWAVSTARRGYVTPTGSYRPTRLHRRWYSRKYDNAPMPHSIFFRGGYAIHGTTAVKSLGRPASHGCVRLAPGNAATLFQLVSSYGPGNTRILITR